MAGAQISGDIDKPLPKPYRLRPEARAALEKAFRSQVLFEAGEGLSVITCRLSPGDYTVGVSNNSWRERPLRILSHCGPIEKLEELPLDQSEKTATGYLPEALEAPALGHSEEKTIAGGDVRIFRVRVREQGIEEIPHVLPPPRPQGRLLALRGIRSIKEAVLARPTFFQHFDGVMVDWRDVSGRDANWIRLQKLRLVVDLTSGLNLFPDLRIIDNVRVDYQASMETIDDVLAKMKLLGAGDMVLSLHRVPENNITREEAWTAFEGSVREICRRAAAQGVTVHLRMSFGKPPHTLKEAVDFVRRVGAVNLRIAPATALLIADKTNPQETAQSVKGILGLWLAATPRFDIMGRLWSAHGSISGDGRVFEYLKAAPSDVVLDAIYEDQDEEYRDARM